MEMGPVFKKQVNLSSGVLGELEPLNKLGGGVKHVLLKVLTSAYVALSLDILIAGRSFKLHKHTEGSILPVLSMQGGASGPGPPPSCHSPSLLIRSRVSKAS